MISKFIKEKTKGFNCEDGGLNSGRLWELKKHLFPNHRDPPTAMMDPQTGNLLTSQDKIEQAALNVYKDRLRNRPINKNIQHIREAKELLCKKFLKLAQRNKTPPWTMKDLELVLNNLKKQIKRSLWAG